MSMLCSRMTQADSDDDNVAAADCKQGKAYYCNKNRTW